MIRFSFFFALLGEGDARNVRNAVAQLPGGRAGTISKHLTSNKCAGRKERARRKKKKKKTKKKKEPRDAQVQCSTRMCARNSLNHQTTRATFTYEARVVFSDDRVASEGWIISFPLLPQLFDMYTHR